MENKKIVSLKDVEKARSSIVVRVVGDGGRESGGGVGTYDREMSFFAFTLVFFLTVIFILL